MALKSTITLSDAATTPVPHVYHPTEVRDNILTWRDRTQTVMLGQNRLLLQQKVANKQSRNNLVSWRLEAPILEQTAAFGPLSLAYTNIGIVQFVLHDRSTRQERADLLQQMYGVMGSVMLGTQVRDLDQIY